MLFFPLRRDRCNKWKWSLSMERNQIFFQICNFDFNKFNIMSTESATIDNVNVEKQTKEPAEIPTGNI